VALRRRTGLPAELEQSGQIDFFGLFGDHKKGAAISLQSGEFFFEKQFAMYSSK